MSTAGPTPPELPKIIERPSRGRVVVFAPHADDEVIGCGGAMALHREQGDPVQVVILTGGLSGDPDGRHAPEELLALREREARAGGAILGVEDYRFWRYPDGHVVSWEDVDHLVEVVRAHLERTRPDIVYYPWDGEAHADHWYASLVVRKAFGQLSLACETLGYEVWTPCVPNLILDVTPVIERKILALREHASQLEYTDHEGKTLGMNRHRSLYLAKESTHGEAFVHSRLAGG